MFIFVLKDTKHTPIVHLMGQNEPKIHFCAHFFPQKINPSLSFFVIKKGIL